MPPQPTLPTLESLDGKAGELAVVCRDFVDGVRARQEEQLWAGAGGLESAFAFSDAVDELMRFIVAFETRRVERRWARGAGQQCAVFAQGGYGRREMNPWSDVDVLVFYPGRLSPYVKSINERILLTLFDAGLQVGHAVRSVKECLDQADRDVTVKTTMLDGRFLAGTPELSAQFESDVVDVLRARDAKRFIDEKRTETRERHGRLGGSVFLLEPNVKDGLGGLRDLHTLLWIARVSRGITTIEGLAAEGVASQGEVDALAAAREFLLRVRSGIHFLVRNKTDKLSFEAQDQIAERFGYASKVDPDRYGNDERASRDAMVEAFMREYYSHAAIIARSTLDIVDRLTAPPEPTGLISRLSSRSLRDGVSVKARRLVVEERIFEADPINLVRIFADSQRCDVRMSAATQDAVRRNLARLTPILAYSDEAIETFMGILKAHDGVYRTLGEMNRLGVLGQLIPEFGRLFCMVQHDYYHVYTVDEHSLVGIRELEQLREGAIEAESPLLTQVMRECDHPEILFLGMMFHDLGKGYGGDHDERGAVMVREVSKRLRMHWDDRRALEFLVRHHLLMSMLAQNRDVEDPKLVRDFVREVGTTTNLRNLYLLTFADMRAVGPKIWNGWKDHLLGELYQRAIEAFETGAITERNLEARIKRAKRRVLTHAGGDDERSRLEEFLDGMAGSYVLSTTVDSVIAHWRLLESLGSGVFRCGVSHYPERGFTELTVCAPNMPGLFARLTGVLSAHRLNILSAKIDTSSTGMALDSFRVEHAHDEVDVVDPELWARVRADIEGVLADRVSVDEMVAEARRSRPAPTSVRKARQRTVTRVGVDNDVSDDYTVIDVYAADRPGLLYTVADCFYDLGLLIHIAKISTRVTQVLDVFYVTDGTGKKIVDEERYAEIEEVVLHAVRESDEQELGRRPGPAREGATG